MLCSDSSSMNHRFRTDALFTAHLHKEGEILLDRGGTLRTFQRRPVGGIDIEHELLAQLRTLDSLRDMRRFNGTFLFCLSSSFSIGKAVVMISLAPTPPS